MKRTRIASQVGWVAAGFGLAASIAIGGATPAHGVTLRVVSANVKQAGETARVCVALESGGTAIAGTQNDLVWDGNCATLSEGACSSSGAHSKQVSTTMRGGPNSTLLSAIVISLSDTDAIGDAVLYCCNFRSELTQSGTTCPINVTNARGSTPDAKPVSITGVPGGITLSSSGSQGGGGGGGGGSVGGPLTAAGGAAPGGAAAGGGAAAAGGGGVAGGLVQPQSQVLQGGTDADRLAAQQAAQLAAQQAAQGTGAGAAAPAAGAPAGAAPGAVASGDGAVVPAATAPAAEGTPAETAATAAPTTAAPAPTTPAAGTPTAKAVAPTAKPTAKPTAAPTKKSESGGGWFGCQLDPAAGAGSAPWLLALGGLALLWRRGRRH